MDDFTNINEHMVVDQTASHQLTESTPEDEADGYSKKARKYTEKALKYQRSVPTVRRNQLHKILMRKSSIIDDLLYSKQNVTVVKESLGQFDDDLKLLTKAEILNCNSALRIAIRQGQHPDNQWFEDVDEMVFSFKHHI